MDPNANPYFFRIPTRSTNYFSVHSSIDPKSAFFIFYQIK